ncbi:MAG TPA: restriction endonuclease subunit S [Rectinemataceae bacterium]|nr:restriction endonuclease subunit S [Rectinemataceae bacterium]
MEVKPGYKMTEVGIIPEEWEVRPLGELGEALIGLTYKPSDVKTYGTLVLRSSNIQNDTLVFDDNVFVDADIPKRIQVRLGDVLICVRNGSRDLIGKAALLDKRAMGMTFGAFMAVYRSSFGELANYLFQSNILKRQITEHLGATINQITNRSLNSFRIPVPPHKEEQRAIVTALSDVDALLDSLDRLIAKKRNLKQAAMQELLTGKTRLPGFGGEWEVKSLGELAEIVSGGTPKTTQPAYWNGVINWCTPTDITSCEGKYLIETERTISQLGLLHSGATILPAGALLLCSRATIGEVKISAGEACTNQGFKSLVCGPRMSNEFLYYSLLTMKQQMIQRAFGSTFLEISKTNLASLEVNIPPLPEQRAIASVLSDMDEELAALEARRDKTRLLKQAMMEELLTGKTRLV